MLFDSYLLQLHLSHIFLYLFMIFLDLISVNLQCRRASPDWRDLTATSALYKVCLLNLIKGLWVKSMSGGSLWARSPSTCRAYIKHSHISERGNALSTGAIPAPGAPESNQCRLNASYWRVYQPLAGLPEAPWLCGWSILSAQFEEAWSSPPLRAAYWQL